MLFPLVKWELQHSVACRKAQKHQHNRECRRCCTIANYSIHSPALAPQTISGLKEKTSQHTLGHMGEWNQTSPLLAHTHKNSPRYQWTGSSTDPLLARQGSRGHSSIWQLQHASVGCAVGAAGSPPVQVLGAQQEGD